MIPTLRIMMNMGGLHRLLPFWLLGVLAMILWPTWWLVLALIYGVIMQFIVEYAMHRFIYHREPPQGQETFNALYRSHIGHHEFPNDPEFFTGDDHWFAVRFGMASVLAHTLILWPLVGLGSAALFSSVAIFVGSISAFIFYEYCHTLAHLKIDKGWFGQKVTQSHMRHHFNDHETVYHVSLGMGWIDRLFGTTYDRDAARQRFDPETILSMGMDPEDLRLVTARKAFGLPLRPRQPKAG